MLLNKAKLTPKDGIEYFLFGSRWLLIPFYVGLIFAMGVYMWVDLKEVTHMVSKALDLDRESAMMVLLELVDMAMIAALVKMIITGGYTSFVDKNHAQNSDKASSGTLKVKMSTSLVGVSSIHLLQKFIDIHELPWETLWKLLAIHASFLLGSLMLAWIELIHVKSEVLELEKEEREHNLKLHENKHKELEKSHTSTETTLTQDEAHS
jgi:uncharacterized protein (TIGR00645 family)